MRIAVRALLPLLLAAIVVIVPSPASAGGPTSVLLVAPKLGKTAALYYSDPEYEELTSLLGGVHGMWTPPLRNAESHETDDFVRVSWLAHDVYAWRVDQIYPTAPGGMRISTKLEPAEHPVWHRIAGDKVLLRLLDKLGLLTAEGRNAATHEAARTTTTTTAAAPAAHADTPSSRLGTLYAFLAGILATLAALWLRTRFRARFRRAVPA